MELIYKPWNGNSTGNKWKKLLPSELEGINPSGTKGTELLRPINQAQLRRETDGGARARSGNSLVRDRKVESLLQEIRRKGDRGDGGGWRGWRKVFLLNRWIGWE
jgi:hypothetical protein